jgi:REP element-mobilizing transposase RayT
MPWDHPYKPPQNARLDPEVYKRAGNVFFITIRARKNTRPFGQYALGKLIIDTLPSESAKCECRVFTYCLMPDHLHFLAGPQREGASLLQFIDRFKGKTTNCSWRLGWNGRLWQPRSYDHAVRAAEDLRGIAEYILQNPVRKGLVNHPYDWPWSGQLNPLPI